MKKFLSEHITERDIHSFALSNVRKRGILRRMEIEEVQLRFPVLRPLRRIHFYDGSNVEVSTSLIDEELSGLTINFNEHILLWRPLYHLLTAEVDQESDLTSDKSPSVQSVIDNILDIRINTQQDLLDFEFQMRDVKANWRSTISLLVPRSPSSLKKQEEVEDHQRMMTGILTAASLIMNCKSEDRIEYGRIGERIYIETALVQYTRFDTASTRIVALEFPQIDTIREAERAGRALTRLCSINETCHNIVDEYFGNF